jgi:hypothetical protein
MAVLFANDAASSLQITITTSQTTITIASGDANLFPAPLGDDYFMATVVDAAGNMEIMKCTGRIGAVLAVTRAQEGTTAVAFEAGAIVDLRLTKGTMEALRQGAEEVTWGEITGKPETFPPSAVSWSSITSKPSTFPPSTHSHTLAISNITGLDTALAGKMPIAGVSGAATGLFMTTAHNDGVTIGKSTGLLSYFGYGADDITYIRGKAINIGDTGTAPIVIGNSGRAYTYFNTTYSVFYSTVLLQPGAGLYANDSYGAANSILASSGSATVAPRWKSFGELFQTIEVGAVGSYAFLKFAGGATATGTAVAATAGLFYSDSTGGYGSNVPLGTWRLHGFHHDFGAVSLWQRIA